MPLGLERRVADILLEQPGDNGVNEFGEALLNHKGLKEHVTVAGETDPPPNLRMIAPPDETCPATVRHDCQIRPEKPVRRASEVVVPEAGNV
jgi:hypothetical protein